MCRRATCKQCGKTTWAGCGQHVDQVMTGVSPAERCPGHRTSSDQVRGTAGAGGGESVRSRLARLFGRG